MRKQEEGGDGGYIVGDVHAEPDVVGDSDARPLPRGSWQYLALVALHGREPARDISSTFAALTSTVAHLTSLRRRRGAR